MNCEQILVLYRYQGWLKAYRGHDSKEFWKVKGRRGAAWRRNFLDLTTFLGLFKKILSTPLSFIYFLTLRNTRCPSQEGNVSLMKNYSKWDSGWNFTQTHGYLLPVALRSQGIQMQIWKRHFSSFHVSKGCLKQEYTPYTCLIFLKQGLQATTDL